MGTEPFRDDPQSSLKDYSAFMRVLRQEILDALNTRNDPEQERTKEALRVERLKTAFADHNRECLQNVGRMIDDRITALLKTDFRELRTDIDAITDQLNQFADSFQEQLANTQSKENGTKTTGNVLNVGEQLSALVKRVNDFESDIIRRIDGYSEKGRLIPGIMGNIQALGLRLASYDKKAKAGREVWRYSLEIFLKLLPIAISATALYLALTKA